MQKQLNDLYIVSQSDLEYLSGIHSFLRILKDYRQQGQRDEKDKNLISMLMKTIGHHFIMPEIRSIKIGVIK